MSPADIATTTVTRPISRADFEAMLTNIDIPDAALRPYLRVDALESSAFAPEVVANPALVIHDGRESAFALASLNNVARWRRQAIYKRKIRNWTGLKVVDEGDSWFQYPFLIEDTIDHLSRTWAIHSCSAAGDLLRDMAKQDEIVSAVLSEKPDLLLLSGGGNDLLGDGAIQRHLVAYKPGRAAADCLNDGFGIFLDQCMEIYSGLIETALTAGARRVICHGYDYAIPANGRWLGRPMARIGYTDQTLQREIVKVMIDRFRRSLSGMANQFKGKVIAVDTRNSVPPHRWSDELHPDSVGFAYPAALIRASGETGKPARFAGQAMPEMMETGLEIAPPAVPEIPGFGLPDEGALGDPGALLSLLDSDDLALMDEIGRRQALMEAGVLDPQSLALDFALRMPGPEGLAADFLGLGKKIVRQLERTLHDVMCGTDESHAELRGKISGSLEQTRLYILAAVSGALIAIGCPPAIAPFVASVIVKKGLATTLDKCCQIWAGRLAE